MKKILGILGGLLCWLNTAYVFAADKFEVLPDLPEPLAAAQASSVSTSNNDAVVTTTQAVGQEPNLLSVVLSLMFVILLIYATGIIYTKLNKVGFNAMRKQLADADDSKVTVISTTPLGSNKTLHVVELDGKRMLIGASSSSIDLIKDLGSYPPQEIEEGEYSKIEIPNIRIPKIEIPKIEFPNIGFTKTFKKNSLKEDIGENNDIRTSKGMVNEDEDGFVISEIYEESSDGIIDKLFVPPKQEKDIIDDNMSVKNNEHSVNPEEYALYKKYL